MKGKNLFAYFAWGSYSINSFIFINSCKNISPSCFICSMLEKIWITSSWESKAFYWRGTITSSIINPKSFMYFCSVSFISWSKSFLVF